MKSIFVSCSTILIFHNREIVTFVQRNEMKPESIKKCYIKQELTSET